MRHIDDVQMGELFNFMIEAWSHFGVITDVDEDVIRRAMHLCLDAGVAGFSNYQVQRAILRAHEEYDR